MVTSSLTLDSFDEEEEDGDGDEESTEEDGVVFEVGEDEIDEAVDVNDVDDDDG